MIKPRGDAWSDLISGLTMLSRHPSNKHSPLHCEHDELWVCADPAEFTAEEIAQLDAWGFTPDDEGGFSSFRFGSA